MSLCGNWQLMLCACVLSHFSHVRLFPTLWTVDCQAPLSMGFSQQEYWSGAMPSLRGSSWPRDQPKSPASPALAGGFFITTATWEATDLDEQKNTHSFLSALLGLFKPSKVALI